MLNQMILKFQRLPKLLVGFSVLLIVLVGLYFYDPPQSICDVQMEEVNARLLNGFYSDKSEGLYGQAVVTAFEFCTRTNSPGGCYDMFTRLDFLEKQVKTIPEKCGTHPTLESIKRALERGLKLFVDIAWGDQPPANKYNKTSWLDHKDIGLFCRLKNEYIRLFGASEWKTQMATIAPQLPGVEGLRKQDIWDKSLFSYPCKGLY